MFTGIIQGLATVVDIIKKEKLYTVKLKFTENLLHHLQVGYSIANNGCCLTVTKIQCDIVYFDIINETLKTTNLNLLRIGSKVNIERSLKFGDEIGGHLITGHVISTAKILNIINVNNNKKIIFKLNNKSVMQYIFLKGFIAIDGISLTVSHIYKYTFSVHFIPETLSCTNIILRKINDIVNIEVDYYTQIIINQLMKNQFFNIER